MSDQETCDYEKFKAEIVDVCRKYNMTISSSGENGTYHCVTVFSHDLHCLVATRIDEIGPAEGFIFDD